MSTPKAKVYLSLERSVLLINLLLKTMPFLFSLKKSSAELKKILANGQVGVITD